MEKTLRNHSFWILLLLLSNTTLASTFHDNAPEKSTPVLEIKDKFNEVRMGLTESSVYMIFSERARSIANKNFQDQYEVDTQKFEDSEGNFIVGSAFFLETNRIEYQMDDISGINFTNGKLTFIYKNKSDICFEDIYSYDGTRALNNFYVEDLEDFIFTFTKSIKS